MVLENWVLSQKDHSEDLNKGPSTVYNNMSMLLKSLLCVSRALPAYRLSRRQGPESYVLCYRVFSGQPGLSVLGDNLQTCHVSYSYLSQFQAVKLNDLYKYPVPSENIAL